MKKLFFTFTFLISSVFIFAQGNKPDANSFGIQYGISYGGTLNQSLIFSGWLRRGIELRGGLLLNFNHADNKQSNPSDVYTSHSTYISATASSESKSGTLTITPNFSVLKHFTTKSNIDPFIGGLVSIGVSMPTIQAQNITETTAINYDKYVNSLSKNPVGVNTGLSLVGGVNYFFVKNFAIGIDAGFGFTTAITNGKRRTTSITRNSGSNNPSATNQTLSTSYDNQSITYNVNLSGNGGLRFTYYIKTKRGPVTTVTQKF